VKDFLFLRRYQFGVSESPSQVWCPCCERPTLCHLAGRIICHGCGWNSSHNREDPRAKTTSALSGAIAALLRGVTTVLTSQSKEKDK
jgi:hypothetical protein